MTKWTTLLSLLCLITMQSSQNAEAVQTKEVFGGCIAKKASRNPQDRCQSLCGDMFGSSYGHSTTTNPKICPGKMDPADNTIVCMCDIADK